MIHTPHSRQPRKSSISTDKQKPAICVQDDMQESYLNCTARVEVMKRKLNNYFEGARE